VGQRDVAWVSRDEHRRHRRVQQLQGQRDSARELQRLDAQENLTACTRTRASRLRHQQVHGRAGPRKNGVAQDDRITKMRRDGRARLRRGGIDALVENQRFARTGRQNDARRRFLRRCGIDEPR
jgi:hypothetical protein